MATDSPDGVIDVDPSPVQRQADYMDVSNYGSVAFACAVGNTTWVTYNLPNDGNYYVPAYIFFEYSHKLPAITYVDICADQTAPVWVTLSAIVAEFSCMHKINDLGSMSLTYPQGIRMGVYNGEQYARTASALLVYYTFRA